MRRVQEMICRKWRDGCVKYVLKTDNGRRIIGEFKTRAEAEERRKLIAALDARADARKGRKHEERSDSSCLGS